MASPKTSEPSIPDDLREALEKTPDAYAAFLVMPPSHRREYLSFIDEAKGSPARARRIIRALEMMSQWQTEQTIDRKQSRKKTVRSRPVAKESEVVTQPPAEPPKDRRKSGNRP